MRRVCLLVVASSLASLAGCLINRGAIGGEDAVIDRPDAWADPSTDADLDAVPIPDAPEALDAPFHPDDDAHMAEVPDAWTSSDAWAPDAAACPRCEGSMLIPCGAPPVACAACGAVGGGAPRCLELVPSNVPAEADLTARADAITIDGELEWDTTNCDGAHLPTSAGNVPGGQIHKKMAGGVNVCAVRADRFHVTFRGRLRAFGSRPLVLLVRDEVRIDAGGVIDVSSDNDESSTSCASGRAGAGAAAPLAPHVGAVGVAGTGMYTPEGGGGGGGFCGSGGRGGDGGGPTGGIGGTPRDPGPFSPLFGGQPGGNGSGSAGEGGRGGGALQLSAPRIVLDGTILAHGAGGLGAGAGGAGGGGGSGGAVHIEGLVVTMGPSSLIDLQGGGGGAGSCYDGDSRPGSCAATVEAPASPDGASLGCGDTERGGTGASGTSPNGTDGDDSNNGSGGGGGAGCLLVRAFASSPTPRTAPDAPRIQRTAPPMVR